jgi:hypothetical protein
MPVLLDTGSSDLWVHFSNGGPSGATDTGKQVSLAYAVGKAAGNVNTAEVKFGTFTVKDQAFLDVKDTSTFTANIHQQGYDGLVGLGPNSGSVIRKKVGAGIADSFIQRLFTQNKQSSNYITFALDRKNDPTDAFKGQFSISEVIPGFENITSMPKLDVDKVNRLLKSDQHWQALTDEGNGIVGPDGNSIKVKSLVPGAPKDQFVAVIDSGFTFSQVPRDVADQIYGRVRGAFYDTQNEWWLVPCGQYLNISFNFGGVNYPVHPLDTVDDNFSRTDNTGKKVCIGAFQPITTAFSLLGNYDMILGMSFLRNAYTLLNFGSWIDGGDDQHPFIQMASLTSVANARADFIQTRLSGTDTISDPRWSLLPADQMVHSPVSEEEKKKRYQELVLSKWPYIFVGCLAFVLLTTGFCIWKCCQRRRARKAGLSNFEDKGKEGFMSGKLGGLFNKKKEEPYGSRGTHDPLPLSNTSNTHLDRDGHRSMQDLSNPFSTPNPSTPDLRSPYADHHPQAPYAQHDARHSQQSYHSGGGGAGDYKQSDYSQHNPHQQQYGGGYQGYPPQHGYQGHH